MNTKNIFSAKQLITLLIATVLCSSAVANAASTPVNLGTWSAESYAAVDDFPSGVWTVAPGGGSVTQSQNGQPTFFYSDFSTFGTSITGKIKVTGSDDDYIGFALGFLPNSSTNAAADYLLVDWKKGTQNFDFSSPSSSTGGVAYEGLAVSRVTGIPDADEFWQHANLLGTGSGSGLEELARGSSLGSTGWALNTEYAFTFDFGPNDLEVWVNGVKEIDITGSFANGPLAFYNFSQAGVIYSAFEIDTGPFPNPIPEPEIYAMLGVGLGLMGWVGRRRRQQQVA